MNFELLINFFLFWKYFTIIQMKNMLYDSKNYFLPHEHFCLGEKV